MGREQAKEWFARAEKDIQEAQFLLENNRPLENICLFIHQAVEKYLKGFLIYHGWELKRVHDLISLLGDAIKIDRGFEKFSQILQVITKYYIDSRYPLEYPIEYSRKEVKKSLDSASELINLIKEKICVEE